MLVLSRKAGEAIHIGSGISVTVLRVRGKGVSLGISAPRTVQVRRTELPSHGSSELPHELGSELAPVCSD